MSFPEMSDSAWSPTLKQTLRTTQKRVLSLVTASARKAHSQAIVDAITRLDVWHSAKSVALYYPMPLHAELDLLPLFELAQNHRKIVAFPVMANEAPALSRVSSLEGFSERGHRFPEPPTIDVIAASEIELFLVPAMAFATNGARLGHGSGFYDRLLFGTRGTKVGVGYSFQIVIEVPMTERDVAMDSIVTERELIVCSDRD